MSAFFRPVVALLGRILFLAFAAAIVPACKHHHDDGAPGVLAFSSSSYTVSESEGTATIIVTRTGGATGPVTVHYFTANDTAATGSDYSAASGTLDFGDGEISKTIDIPILEDALAEESESFLVILSNAGGGAILGSPSFAVVTIEDNDIPTLSIADASVAEGASGTANLVFTVTLSLVSTRDVLLDYTATGATAEEGTDYMASAGTLTIPAGQTSGQIIVGINGDTVDENDEMLTVTLSNPVNATILDGQATGTILNDDDPAISIDDVTAAEGNSGLQDFTFTVTLSRQSLQDVAVAWAMADGSATAGQDYVAGSGTLTIPAGQTSGQIVVQVLGDTTGEFDETFVVSLSAPTNATIADGQGAAMIVNDDLPAITLSDGTVTEGNGGAANMVFTVTLSGPSPQPVSVNWGTSDGTAKAGQDYVAGSGILTIPADQTTGQIVVPVLGDTTDENDENFMVTLSNPVNGTIGAGTATGTIIDDDGPTISIANVTATEGDGGTKNFTFTVTLSAASPQPVSVDWATENGTAAAGSDYTAASGTLTIPANQTYDQIVVQVLGDMTSETDETFTVNLSNPSNAQILISQGVGTIFNDDPPPSIAISDVSWLEGNSGQTQFYFRITLSNAADRDIHVDYSTQPNTATEGIDYQGAAGSITIPAGSITADIPVAVMGDDENEGDETFYVRLTGTDYGTITDSKGLGAILDDEAPRVTQATPADGSIGVDPSTNITLTFSKEMDRPSVEDAISSAPALPAGTFTWAGNTVTFTPSTPLNESTEYVLTVAPLAADLHGIPLDGTYSFRWRTGLSYKAIDLISDFAIPTNHNLVAPSSDGRYIYWDDGTVGEGGGCNVHLYRVRLSDLSSVTIWTNRSIWGLYDDGTDVWVGNYYPYEGARIPVSNPTNYITRSLGLGHTIGLNGNKPNSTHVYFGNSVNSQIGYWTRENDQVGRVSGSYGYVYQSASIGDKIYFPRGNTSFPGIMVIDTVNNPTALETTLLSGDSRIQNACGIVSDDTHLYVINYTTQEIQKVDPSGTGSIVATFSPGVLFENPALIGDNMYSGVRASKYIYILNKNNGTTARKDCSSYLPTDIGIPRWDFYNDGIWYGPRIDSPTDVRKAYFIPRRIIDALPDS